MSLKSVSLFACVVSSLLAVPVYAASPGSVPTFSFRAPDGETFLAVGLRTAQPEPGATSHVVLVDTSASQIGEYRSLALATVTEFLSRLPQDHTVSLMAIDVHCVALTDGFVPVGSPALQAGLQKLVRRAPLGATDLNNGLDRVIAHIGDRPRTEISYIGDGMSAAQLLSVERFSEIVAKLRDARVPFNSFAVGPQTDLSLLGVLALQTGGNVILETEGITAEQAATDLYAAASQSPVYPTGLQTQSRGIEVSVSAPLRSDRETFVLAKGKFADRETIVARVGERDLQWTVAPGANPTQYPFLANTWSSARNQGGLTAGFAGSELLVMASGQFDANLDQLKGMGRMALALQQFDQAREIGRQIEALDPTNDEAGALLAATDRKVRLVSFAKDEQPAAEDDNAKSQIERDKELLQIRGEQLTVEVNTLIEQARKLSLNNADDALMNLKSALGTVTTTNDVLPNVRDQLASRLRSTIQEVQGRKEVQDLKLRQDRIKATEQASLERIQEEMRLDDEKFQQLLERVRALMIEGRHGIDQAYEDAEAVAEEAINIRPESGPAAAAYFKAEASGQLTKAFRLRFRRADEFLAVLYEVEKSHVPFPDEPPIRWPSPEVWQDMTERRRKWNRTNLKQNSPIEERIIRVLDEPYKNAQFLGQTLGEVMDGIASSKLIPWAPGEGVDPSEPVPEIDMITNLPPDIYPSLRSVLKRVLGSLGYRYMIKDETMMIVTEADEEDTYFTYVYPVGDLVIIPQQLMMGAQQLVGNAGGVGNGLTQNGGLNSGGQGGQQGGGGGGQFGGGNQGFLSVRPQARNNAGRPAANPPGKAAQPQKPAVDDAELKQLIERPLEPQSSVATPREMYQAQIRDDVKPFQLDNSNLIQLKKKPLSRN